MELFDNISPLDYRYYGRDSNIKSLLQPYLSENARIRYQCRVEAALGRALAKKGLCSAKIAEEIGKACECVTAEEVYAGEDQIKHDVRALANAIRDKVGDEAKPFVHFGATSYDIVDTANALRYKEATEKALVPELKALERTWIELALREKSTLQIGRTHGQHAEPITFGFAISNYVSRLGSRIQQLESCKEKLVGKFSGAVGAYNSSSLFFEDPMDFEKTVLSELGLNASISSTQIAEPEPLTDFMHAVISTFGVLADFSDDMRHLQRSEIAEVGESFGKGQVGSSTMPHKRNPINFENVKSFYKAFMPRMISVYLDQLSEHQRDLTNSASARFLPETLAALYVSANRLDKASQKMVVDADKMKRNFGQSQDLLLAEPVYLLLASHGHSNAHEASRAIAQEAREKNVSFKRLLQEKEELKHYWNRLTPAQQAVFENPANYTGIAAKKTEQVCRIWKEKLQL